MRRKDGTFVWTLARATAVRDSTGKAVALAGSHIEIGHLIQAEKSLLNEVFLDQLTGLPNRASFMGRLKMAVANYRQRQAGGSLFAVMFLDLNRFKIVNDSLGHLVGDELLKEVAARLRSSARPNDVVARFGGDEFVILLENLREPDEAMRVASRIQRALSVPFNIGGREIMSGASIGIALSSARFDSEDDLLRYGDIAMYHAKAHKRGDAQLFDDRMIEPATKLCRLQNDLARALERQELLLHYQPFLCLQTGKIVGTEALVRWQRSDGTLLYPSEFIPLAEEMGLINEIGEWVLKTASRQSYTWQQAGLAPLRMAVNLSAHQLQEKDFPQSVSRILNDSHIPLQCLELELTETAFMGALDVAVGTLEQLQRKGVRMSIDDFGTGYSSLDYLRRFDFHSLKIDRCFVSDLTSDPKAAAIAKGIISLAHDLGLSVIAEGVELSDQMRFLSTHLCDQVQGYFIGRPMLPEQIQPLIHSGGSLVKLPDAMLAQSELSRLNDSLLVGRQPSSVSNLRC